MTCRATQDSIFFYGLEPDSLVSLDPRIPWLSRPDSMLISASRVSDGVLVHRHLLYARPPGPNPETVGAN